MKICFFIVFVGLSFSTFAEYRAYQYYVKAKELEGLDRRAYVVTSTLDPVSYVTYHGGKEVLTVDLLRSWVCRGNTGKKPICPPPLDLLAPFSPYLP